MFSANYGDPYISLSKGKPFLVQKSLIDDFVLTAFGYIFFNKWNCSDAKEISKSINLLGLKKQINTGLAHDF